MPKRDPSVVSEAAPVVELYQSIQVNSVTSTAVREKLVRQGPAALSNTDLLAVILAPVRRRVVEQLLRRYGLRGIAELTLPGFVQFGGLGKGSGARLSAILEIARRINGFNTEERPRLSRPRDAFEQVKEIGRLRREHLVGLYLDAQNGLLHRETLSVGSLNTTRTHPREILNPAITHLALGFILAHNHPSGGLDPSDEDVAFSRAVQRAAEIVGIEFFDHLIVTTAGFTSLRERGVL